MADAIAHRGPDDAGIWLDTSGRVALGHRRLAIVDLSTAGHQPMVSPVGRYVIAFNGEIYNHLALRRELEATGKAPAWKGHSDTETLLAGFEVWGIEATVKKSVGMFAFAVWDKLSARLTLCRDRLGEKPLYYGWQGSTFMFGSELKALKAHPAFRGEVDRNALSLFMRYSAVPAPYSIYQGIGKLQPGCMLSVSLSKVEPEIHAYWSGRQVAENGLSLSFTDSPVAAVEQLERLLLDAVGLQMMSDVPLGAFLSGGVDSSTVVALMQAQSERPVKTFSIGFHEQDFNEAEHAKAVADHLRTEHTELYVSSAQAMEVIPKLPRLYDEPFADSSQIPTFLVSRLARESVAVSLSGDGADELFGGYTRYSFCESLWRRISALPKPVRGLLAKGVVGVSPAGWDALAKPFASLLRAHGLASPGDKLHKGADLLNSQTQDEFYWRFLGHWPAPGRLVIGGSDPFFSEGCLSGRSGIERMMVSDLLTYLPDDILTKVDRAAMGVSLETRVPFLDHRVVEFAWCLPLAYKLRDGQSKWALRQVLYRHVPKELIERPKKGFSVPVGAWLRGPLREWAEDLLSESCLSQQGYLNARIVRQVWGEHLSGQRNWQYRLWDVLMFQAWLAEQS